MNLRLIRMYPKRLCFSIRWIHLSLSNGQQHLNRFHFIHFSAAQQHQIWMVFPKLQSIIRTCFCIQTSKIAKHTDSPRTDNLLYCLCTNDTKSNWKKMCSVKMIRFFLPPNFVCSLFLNLIRTISIKKQKSKCLRTMMRKIQFHWTDIFEVSMTWEIVVGECIDTKNLFVLLKLAFLINKRKNEIKRLQKTTLTGDREKNCAFARMTDESHYTSLAKC